MKRSDMLKILRNAFIEHMNCSCCDTEDQMYSKILLILEQQGMMPPVTMLSHLKVLDSSWDPEPQKDKYPSK